MNLRKTKQNEKYERCDGVLSYFSYTFGFRRFFAKVNDFEIKNNLLKTCRKVTGCLHFNMIDKLNTDDTDAADFH